MVKVRPSPSDLVPGTPELIQLLISTSVSLPMSHLDNVDFLATRLATHLATHIVRDLTLPRETI
ncbi:protein of unknown function [Thauera humireducens]|nr:protein of unknown function [Thauera humireducens]